jgi:hypothetical protein
MAAYPHGDPDAVVRAILATSPYRHPVADATAPAKPSLMQLLWQWYLDHVWEPLVHWLSHVHIRSFGSAGGDAATIVGYGVVAVACFVLAFALYRLIVAFARTGSGEGTSSNGGRVALERTLSSQQWRARAAEAARAGDYGRAIAALFTASLATLDERAIVAFDATRTPGEYRRLVRRVRAAAAEPFNDLCGRFVRAAYAEAVATADDYAAAERAFAAFEPATVGAG